MYVSFISLTADFDYQQALQFHWSPSHSKIEFDFSLFTSITKAII